MNEKTAESIMVLNEKSAFLKHNAIRVVSVSEEESVLEAEITDTSKNIWGMVHGGLIFTLADTAAGALARMHQASKNVTLNTFISYISEAKNTGKLYAICKEDHAGRSVGVYNVQVVDDHQKVVAIATVTMKFLTESRH